MTSHDIIRHRVEYVRVTPGSRIGLVSVSCEPQGASATEVIVRYTLTALSEAGNRQLEAFDARYDASIDEWREGIEKALAR